MEGRAHRIQCLFTAGASARAAALGIELHFSFAAGEALPQVGDFVGIARGGPKSRFAVREREFLWDGDPADGWPSTVLLMLDLPDQQWGEAAAGRAALESEQPGSGRTRPNA
jgi:hypothetical protein